MKLRNFSLRLASIVAIASMVLGLLLLAPPAASAQTSTGDESDETSLDDGTDETDGSDETDDADDEADEETSESTETSLADQKGATTLIPVCIDDDLAQKSSGARRKGVGDEFKRKGLNYLIVTGGVECAFDCVDGFDFNCDGKLGDFCSIEHDRTTVAGIKACIKESAARAKANASIQ